MSAGWHVDAREFQAALVAYAAASKREFADVLNRVARDVCLRAAQIMPVARVDEIKTLQERPWWPKLVAKILSGLHSSTCRIGRDGYRRYWPPSYSQTEAKAKSMRMISRRVRAITFLKSGFIKAASKFPQGRVVVGRAARQHSKAAVFLASRAMLRAAFVVTWPTARMASAMRVRSITNRALEAAIAFKTRDMWTYIDRKNAELCRQFSGV